MTRSPTYLQEGMRWFGPDDAVPLAHLRQAGASAVFSALHDVPYGEAWPREAVHARRNLIEAAGMRWAVAESVPLHEDIKVGDGNLKRLFDNYATSIRNLAAEGVRIIVYNFMPVLDWVRTDMRWPLPSGALSMHFDPVRFAAFELFALGREDAADCCSAQQYQSAKAWWESIDGAARERFVQSIIDVFPGCKLGLCLDDIRAMLHRYQGMTDTDLAANLRAFLQAVVPVAEEVGVRLAIHPDDPPFPILGLPRIVSTAAHLDAILCMSRSEANGVCFCSGSLSARADNCVPAMAGAFAARTHAVHLRSTQRLGDGSFYEAEHLGGSVNMPAVMAALLREQDRRQRSGREDWQLIFRPDHGHVMMDDLSKPPGVTPGYSSIGRMKGLAELRGLMHGIRAAASV